MKHKNHVSSRAKNIRKEMNRKFNISESDIAKALNGDEKALKAIAQMGIDGEKLQRYAPQVSEHVRNSMKGTQALNKMWSDIYVDGGRASLDIENQQARTELANTSLVNQRIERANEFVNNQRNESLRHQNQLEYLRMKAEIDDIEKLSDHDYRIAQVSNRLELQQIKADRDYQSAKTDHILQNGESSRVDLIPRKDYKKNLMSKAIDFFTGNW
jgi:hypothetical protein